MTTANVSSSLAGLKAMRGEFDEARAYVATARRVYSDLGLRFAIAGLAHIAGTIEVLADDLDAGERAWREGYDILAGVGARGLLAAELGRVLVAQGRIDAAVEFVAEADQATGGDVAPQVLARLTKSRIAAARGLMREAVDLASDATALAEQTDALVMVADANFTLSEALATSGRDEEAAVARARALACYADKGHILGEREAETPLIGVRSGGQRQEGRR